MIRVLLIVLALLGLIASLLIGPAPIDLPAARLVREFEKIQAEYADRFAFNPTPGRPMFDSSQRRVWFAVLRNDGRTWAELIAEWNELHPSEASPVTGKEASAFTRSIRRGYARIMERRFVWKGSTSSED